MFLLSKLNYRTWSQWSETECGNKEEKSSVFSKKGWRARAGELRWQTIVCWQISQWTEQTGYSVLHRACKATLTTFQIPHFLSVLPLVLTAQKCIITKPSPTKILRKGFFFFCFCFLQCLLSVEWIIHLQNSHLKVGGSGRGRAVKMRNCEVHFHVSKNATSVYDLHACSLLPLLCLIDFLAMQDSVAK